MKLLNRLFRAGPDDRAGERPLWHAIVGAARRPRWYADLGVADTVEGRFDMVSIVLALVLLRTEVEQAFAGSAARLTELFIDDMDAQLRQAGVGDLVVGKHVGKLLGVLGGRLGALRLALTLSDDQPLIEVIGRNVTMADPGRSAALAGALRSFSRELGERDTEQLLAGDLP